jgi:hypothetical protein
LGTEVVDASNRIVGNGLAHGQDWASSWIGGSTESINV